MRAASSRPRVRGQAIQRPEQSLQITVVDFLRRALISPARVWFVPNGGHLSKAQRGLFMRMGLLSGVSDLHLIWPGHYGVLEMKAPGKGADTRVSQILFQDDVAACGHHHAIADSFEAAISAVRGWGAPLNPAVRF